LPSCPARGDPVTRPFRELVEALSPARQEQIAAKTELLMEIEALYRRVARWKAKAKEYKQAFDYTWECYQDLGREWADGSVEYEAKIKALETENAALRENESRLAFHVVPELEEQLRAADKLAAEVKEQCAFNGPDDCDHEVGTYEDNICSLADAYLTARGKE
jgi:hypothetical protein